MRSASRRSWFIARSSTSITMLGEECARRGEFSPEQLVGKQFRAQVVRSGKNFDGKYRTPSLSSEGIPTA